MKKMKIVAEKKYHFISTLAALCLQVVFAMIFLSLASPSKDYIQVDVMLSFLSLFPVAFVILLSGFWFLGFYQLKRETVSFSAGIIVSILVALIPTVFTIMMVILSSEDVKSIIYESTIYVFVPFGLSISIGSIVQSKLILRNKVREM